MKQAVLPGRFLFWAVSLAWLAGMIMLHAGYHPYKGFLIWFVAILFVMMMAGTMPGMLKLCSFICIADAVLCIVYMLFSPHLGFFALHLADAVICSCTVKVHS